MKIGDKVLTAEGEVGVVLAIEPGDWLNAGGYIWLLVEQKRRVYGRGPAVDAWVML